MPSPFEIPELAPLDEDESEPESTDTEGATT